MTVKEMAFKVEDLGVRAWTLCGLAQAINDGLYQGESRPDSYEGAFMLLLQIAYQLKGELDDATKELFAALQSSQK